MLNAVAVTSEETRIILSFAMAEHGGLFANWLRDKLMKRFSYYSRNNVYMDCVAVRGLKSEHSLKPEEAKDRKSGVTYVFPDTRPHILAQGYQPIGAMNSDWDTLYKKAMSQAHTMIMVVTPSYLASQWCMQEWAQFQTERQRRSAFKGIGIRFYESLNLTNLKSPGGEPEQEAKTVKQRIAMYSRKNGPDGTPVDQTGIQFLTFSQTKGGPGNGLLWHPDSWGICDNDFDRLCSTIGNG